MNLLHVCQKCLTFTRKTHLEYHTHRNIRLQLAIRVEVTNCSADVSFLTFLSKKEKLSANYVVRNVSLPISKSDALDMEVLSEGTPSILEAFAVYSC